MIKIAILGLGTVGTGVVKVVEANTTPIQHKLGQPLSVKTALVRKLRAMHWVRECSTGMPPPTLASNK